MGVGGRIARFVQPASREELIAAVRGADARHAPLCVIGGGSNLLAADDDFPGVVIRDARRRIRVLDRGGTRSESGEVYVSVDAGTHWDDFVARSVHAGFAGVEALSGVPGTVGASVVQNIGAYGQDVASAVVSVEAWDRSLGRVRRLSAARMGFGYRTSALKASMYRPVGPFRNGSDRAAFPANPYFPTPRYVVLRVVLALTRSAEGVVAFRQLAHAVGAPVGSRLPLATIRHAVLTLRAAKGMLEDPHRYQSAWLSSMRDAGATANAEAAMRTERGRDSPDPDRHSCGSFFINPVLPESAARQLPSAAPRFPAKQQDGSPGVKTSAAWLIDRAGFHKGFSLPNHPRASLSTRHTLALTNRGGATAADILALARAVQSGVKRTFGIQLRPEPVLIGLTLR